MDVLSEIEEVAKKNSLPSIGPIKGEIVKKVIKQYKPKRLLEIGTLHGYSAILMANYVLHKNDDSLCSCKDDANDNDKEVIVTCLEIDKQLANITRKNVEKAGLSDRMKVITGDALKIIPMLDKTQKFDFVFLDAEKNQYFLYLKLLEENNLLDKKVTIVADNVLLYENEMKDYLDYVRNSGRYNSITTETSLEFNKNIDDALEISRTTTFG